jgi:hypothetical protein
MSRGAHRIFQDRSRRCRLVLRLRRSPGSSGRLLATEADCGISPSRYRPVHKRKSDSAVARLISCPISDGLLMGYYICI